MSEVAFRTKGGRDVPSVTRAEMREVDRVAVEVVGLSLPGMMENAGRNLARVADRMSGSGTVLVLAGNGGNGGGGICAARHLANHGRAVRLALNRAPRDLDGAAAKQFSVAKETPADVAGGAPGDPGTFDPARIDRADLVVDALIGYGLTGAPRGRVADMIDACRRADRVLSLDVPSGLDATSGERPGVAVHPDRTLTLALPKTGLAAVEGDLRLADIGIPQGVYDRAGIAYPAPFEGEYVLPLERSRG